MDLCSKCRSTNSPAFTPFHITFLLNVGLLSPTSMHISPLLTRKNRHVCLFQSFYLLGAILLSSQSLLWLILSTTSSSKQTFSRCAATDSTISFLAQVKGSVLSVTNPELFSLFSPFFLSFLSLSAIFRPLSSLHHVLFTIPKMRSIERSFTEYALHASKR